VKTILYSWGAGAVGQLGIPIDIWDSVYNPVPRIVTSLAERKIEMLAAGAFHSIALTDTGVVYSWGLGKAGQLGYACEGEYYDDPQRQYVQTEPRVVTTGGFDDTIIGYIAAGGLQSAAISLEDGGIFTWGHGEYGLGHGGRTKEIEPRRIDDLEPLLSVDVGENHMLALSKEGGKVYSWGIGSHGMLGHCTEAGELRPRMIESLLADEHQVHTNHL